MVKVTRMIKMVTVEFTEAEAEALGYLVMGVDEPEDEEALRTTNNKLTEALELAA